MPKDLILTIVRWIFAITALGLWILAGLLILFPPGDNLAAQDLSQIVGAGFAFFAFLATCASAIASAVGERNDQAQPAP